jgi:hypothetical protein
MAEVEDEDISAFETKATEIDSKETDEIRKTIGDVYTFVRSAEINKTISSFTFDHYIDEAKRRIKDSRVLRAASDPKKGTGTRLGQLESLEKLQQDFENVFEKAKQLAEQKDAGTK